MSTRCSINDYATAAALGTVIPNSSHMALLPAELIREVLRQFWEPLSFRQTSANLHQRVPGSADESAWFAGRKTLYNLCLVSSSIDRLARPLLYHSVTLFSNRGLGLLFRTLMESKSGIHHGAFDHRGSIRNLACFVKLESIDLYIPKTVFWPRSTPPSYPLSRQLEEIVLRVVELPSLTNARGFHRLNDVRLPPPKPLPQVSDGKHAESTSLQSRWGGPNLNSNRRPAVLIEQTPDPSGVPTPQRIFAAILGIAPELRCLLITDPGKDFMNLNLLVKKMRQIPLLAGRVLPFLETLVTYEDGRLYDQASPVILSSFLELESLREVNFGYGASPCLPPDQMFPQLEVITFRSRVTPGYDLAMLSKSCPRLRRLELSVLLWREPNALEANKTLPSMASSLRSLTWKMSPDAQIHYGETPYNTPPLACLPKLVSLTELTIDVIFLFPDFMTIGQSDLCGRLPRSLVRLKLRDRAPGFLEPVISAYGGVLNVRQPTSPMLFAAAERCPSMLPNLRELVYDYDIGVKMDEESLAALRKCSASLRRAFQSAGIRFELINPGSDLD